MIHPRNTSNRSVGRDILLLALPALGVLAANPLYVLLDTAIVGRLGTVQLAALAAGAAIQSLSLIHISEPTRPY